jgi:hypothetical protein
MTPDATSVREGTWLSYGDWKIVPLRNLEGAIVRYGIMGPKQWSSVERLKTARQRVAKNMAFRR